ncbi:hypothetical protein [Streptomyces sp. NPDC002758]
MGQPRYIGTDHDTGKAVLVVAEPFGVLDRMADVAALEACAMLLAVVDTVLDAEDELSADELSVFLRPAVEMLRDVAGIAAKHVEGR